MESLDDDPQLLFFSKSPDHWISRPPLCSSLQTLESCFLFLALNRFPHALTSCAAAIESAMKSALGLDETSTIKAHKLYADARNEYRGLDPFDGGKLKEFREKRNGIAHYGFSPKDDEEAARLLLGIGLPFLASCYKEFFGFNLLDSLRVSFREQLDVALRVYKKVEGIQHQDVLYCFLAFSFQIRWSIRESMMSEWELDAVRKDEENGERHMLCSERKSKLVDDFNPSWELDCPLCDDIENFVCELDNDSLNRNQITFRRAKCANCGFSVPSNCPHLVDSMCANQVESREDEILGSYGKKS